MLLQPPPAPAYAFTARCSVSRLRALLCLVVLAFGVLACPLTDPPPPVGPLECRGKPTKIDVVWEPVEGAASYRIERGEQDGPLATVAEVSGSVFADFGLTNGRTYHYAVYSRRANGKEALEASTCTAQPRDRGERPPLDLPPQISSQPVEVAIESVAYRYDVEASDPEGQALVYALEVAPASMTIDPATGVIAWLPGAADVGSVDVQVAVSDPAGGTARQGWTIVVEAAAVANLPPAITSAPLTTATAGSGYVYAVVAVDPEGAQLTYALDVAPTGM